MALGPTYTYDAQLISPGVNLTLTGVGTPNLTASYSDFGSVGGAAKAHCTISIDYSNIEYVINSDNSISVTGHIAGGVLVRTSTGVPLAQYQQVTAWFNNQLVFDQLIQTDSSGTYPLNIPSTFEVTIPPSLNPQPQWPAAIHFKNDNTTSTARPDEFYFGLGITNPNPPDYRPGERKSGQQWLSHNRNGGNANVLVNGTWTEMRTITGTGNPPLIRRSNAWINQAKLGVE